jgi:hypothetical protein
MKIKMEDVYDKTGDLFERLEAYRKASIMNCSGVSNCINPAYGASRAYNLLIETVFYTVCMCENKNSI